MSQFEVGLLAVAILAQSFPFDRRYPLDRQYD